MKQRYSPGFAIGMLAILAAGAAHAHTGGGEPAGFARGFAHPFAGVDHLIAMVAVGAWAARRGGRALWLIPAAFIGTMALGAYLATKGVGLPFAESGVLISLLVFGVAIVAAVRIRLWVSVAIAAAFAIFHGHLHGSEMPPHAAALTYGSGFVFATALLNGAGMMLVAATRRLIFAARRMMY